MPLGERPELGREEIGADPVRRADAHGAGEGEVRAAEFACHRQRLGLHRLRLGQQPLALLGQGVALRAALEQLGLESGLQGRDAARNGGMIGLELASGRRQAPGAGDGQEKAEIVPVECTHGIGIFAQRCLGFTHSRAISTMIERGH